MHDDIKAVSAVPEKDHNNNDIKPTEGHDSFHTPEEVAAHDGNGKIDGNPDNKIEGDVPQVKDKPLKPTGLNHTGPKKHRFWPLNKKQWIIAGSSVAVLAIIVGGIVFVASRHKPTVATITRQQVHVTTPVKSNTVPSTLSGLPVNPSANARPITAVMIENTPAARPQSGLSQAGVVFEALTEGGISRFMALYQDQTPTNVGPVRSVRPYYIDWALGFDAPIAHDGGSPLALSDLTAWGAKNLDQMYNPGPYTRISSRPAPHNLYASIPGLISLEASNGWTSSNYNGWPRKADAPSKNPNAANIVFNLSYSTYNVQYTYDTATNSYNRNEDGAPQIDANNNQQLSPKVVIGMIVPYSLGPLDSSNAYYSVYQTIGTGQAYVFQDGTVTIGTWSKTSANAPLQFLDSSGQPIKLNAGQTWITALKSNQELTYN